MQDAPPSNAAEHPPAVAERPSRSEREYVMRGALRWTARDDCHVQFFKRGTLRRVTYLRLDARYQFINTWDRLQAWGRRDREIETHDFCHCHDRLLDTIAAGANPSDPANAYSSGRSWRIRTAAYGGNLPLLQLRFPNRNLRDATSRTRYARIICASQEIAIKRES